MEARGTLWITVYIMWFRGRGWRGQMRGMGKMGCETKFAVVPSSPLHHNSSHKPHFPSPPSLPPTPPLLSPSTRVMTVSGNGDGYLHGRQQTVMIFKQKSRANNNDNNDDDFFLSILRRVLKFPRHDTHVPVASVLVV